MVAGKTAVVTGASRGIGLEICRVLAAHGARIVALDASAEHAQLARAALAESGVEDVLAIAADVASSEQVRAAFTQIEQAAGGVDILVNNAGVREIRSALELEPEEWDRTIAINLSGPFYCAREAAKNMRRHGIEGAIVNIASVAALIGVRNRPAYCASKHGLIGLTKNLAAELSAHGIRVNAVAPGVIRTPLTERYFDDEGFLAGIQHAVPLHSRGTSTDIANAVLFLCSPQSHFVTGVTLPVDGGFTAEKSYTSAASRAFLGSSSSSD
ncbi:MAG: family oxidoreductase [Panacagrimonas sp.]|jgi:NAD(P)-dependent dehydrogenase (short-subunit alcohol dehydrogenase family)|nr:SDR family NAD(P)-dependent oxidoreductase [Panacagrimonas sp.]MCC2658756.1 family oxidoreductase [Panacagrimonas sp.]